MHLASLALLATQTNPITNIMIAEKGNDPWSPCEPSIAVSKMNPKFISAGVILDRAISTRDGGVTWNTVKLNSQHGVYGDPTLISDYQGNFYFFSLSGGKTTGSWLDRILCQKSTDGGLSWTDGPGLGLNVPKQQDKQWVAPHVSKPILATTWTEFDKYGSKESKDESRIRFSITTNGGTSWSEAKTISDISGDCIDSDNTTEGAVPAIDLNGVISVVWSVNGIIFFDQSKDNGVTWLPNDRPIARHYGGWDMTIPGLGRSNGMPVLMVDNGKGQFKNSLYMVFADQRLGAKDTDIIFMRSRDSGKSWTAPMTVNKDNSGRHQFMPWMAVDWTTGNIYIVYYDRRAYTDNQTDVYIAYSTDGGTSFTEKKISTKPFTPTTGPFFGDYNNISAHGGIIAPIWTRMDENKTTVWSAVIRHAQLAAK